MAHDTPTPSVRAEVAEMADRAGWNRMQANGIDVYYTRGQTARRRPQVPVVLEWNGDQPRAVWLDGIRHLPEVVDPYGVVYSMAFVFDLNLAAE